MQRALLFTVFAVFTFLPFTADATTPNTGSLIKASGPSVYYYGTDVNRYVFPNEKTYFTWYQNFDAIQTVTDAELAAIPVVANVTYRPGTRMVKIESDPKVYAVARGGVLRWIETEQVASDLYGGNWNTMVDDVSVAFFVNYLLGTSITNAADFDRLTEQALANTIDANRLPAVPTEIPPEPTPTSTEPPPEPAPVRGGTLIYTPETASANKLVTLIATPEPSNAIRFVDVFFNGFLMRRCEFSPCGADVYIPADRTTSVAVAEFIWGDGTRFMTTTTIDATAADPGITLTITRPEVEPGSQREIIVDVDATFVANTIDIYLDGSDVRGCNALQQCRYTAEETSPEGTIHTVYAIAKDANGFTRQSGLSTFSVVANAKPIVSIAVGKTFMYAGESIDVTVSASDSDGVSYTEITTDDGSFTKRCESSICTADVPRPNAGTFSFIGTAADTMDAIATATSDEIVVQ
jgi:hypothetical protein